MLTRIDAIGRSLEQVIQAYDGAQLRLQAVERSLSLNEYALGVARHNLRASQQRLAQRLVSLYENGRPGTLDVLAGAQSLSDLIDRIESTQVLTNQDAAIGEATFQFKLTVQRREALLRHQRRERTATVARLAEKRRTIQSALAEQRRLLASIHRTIGQLEAQQAAEIRARQQERARALQLAAERAAAQQQEQEQAAPPTPAPSSVPGVVSSPTAAPIVPSSSGGGHPEAAAIATRYLGVPYVWGGASPGGFDCSGLVMYVYAQLGISLPHYTVAQWNATIPISTSDLQPGDLVFFDGLGHVGIYLGGGQFIHAPHTGTVVQISSLSGYWASSLVGARRVP